MSGTVAQNQVSAFTSPSNGDALDATVVKANDNATRTAFNTHDADPTIHVQSSVLASRPAAATTGRLWLTSDGLRFYYDTGSAWSEAAYLPLVGGTLTGGLTGTSATFSGALTVSGLTTLNAGLSLAGTLNGAAASFTTLGASGAVTLSSTLNVSGATILAALNTTSVTCSGGIAHTGSTVGFFNATPHVKNTISGGITGTDAMAQAIGIVLQNLGLVTINNTSGTIIVS
jgi:hypothetical protein